MRPPVPTIRLQGFQECLILERLNRFVVKIRIKGRNHRAHINNTGRLTEFMIPGTQAFCLPRTKPGKTAFRLFAVSRGERGALIDTQFQMQAFESALENSVIDWLEGCRFSRRNAKLGTSLIDYSLACRGSPVFCEIKSAVLKEGEHAMYPDCPSLRGQRHIRELTDHVQRGGRGMIVFMAALPGVKAFRPNREADPDLYEALIFARTAGVEIHALGLDFNPPDGTVRLYDQSLRIDL